MNPKAKIAFFEVKEWEMPFLEPIAKELKAEIFTERVDEVLDKAKDFFIISTFIQSDLCRQNLIKLTKLKFIATRSTGFDHIDTKYCQQKKILIANVPSYGENTVAEHAFALILALSRRIVEANERVRSGSFSPAGLTGTDLFGKTIGIIGLGRIGIWVLKMAKGFGMKVLVQTRTQNLSLAKGLGFKYVDLETCLKQSDVISLHVPLNPQTKHLINQRNVKLMKRGSFLVNTSRGPIIETEAIIWALKNNVLSGVGLDVFEEENIIGDPIRLLSKPISNDELKDIALIHLLREMPNVIITPHNAFNTKEAINRIIETTRENISRFKKGQPINLIS